MVDFKLVLRQRIETLGLTYVEEEKFSSVIKDKIFTLADSFTTTWSDKHFTIEQDAYILMRGRENVLEFLEKLPEKINLRAYENNFYMSLGVVTVSNNLNEEEKNLYFISAKINVVIFV